VKFSNKNIQFRLLGVLNIYGILAGIVPLWHSSNTTGRKFRPSSVKNVWQSQKLSAKPMAGLPTCFSSEARPHFGRHVRPVRLYGWINHTQQQLAVRSYIPVNWHFFVVLINQQRNIFR
jgi:hypothetical protein